MQQEDYDYVNSYLKKIIKTKEEYLAYFPVLKDMALFIYQMTKNQTKDYFFTSLDYADSFKLVADFFKEYCPFLLDNYWNIQSFTDKVIIESISGELKRAGYTANKNASGITKEGKIVLCLNGSVQDIFVIAHEFMHAIFLQSFPAKEPFNYAFLAELNSITIEFLLAQYLHVHNLYEKDARSYIANRFYYTSCNALMVLYELMLIKIVQDKKDIQEETIKAYINTEDTDLQEDLNIVKDWYFLKIKQEGLHLFSYSRYIWGLFLACYLKEEIAETKDSKKILKIGKAIYQEDIYQALKDIDLAFFNPKLEYNQLYPDLAVAFMQEYFQVQAKSR